ncbi:dihydroorotate dehydrogenase electron transfer subunit [Paenibacillus yanchengensis]|uniref:Dihydroorotate dehydrogenase B (NAD(+)), electron transfer subunit n=1 Tax=Paenibacillus yanchengensis TaxID=2035833 RepID=A0ABW4YIT2_9BACL
MCVIVRNSEIACHIYELVLKGELVQLMQEPGQFVHVKVTNETTPLLRRPLSIANIDHHNNEFTLIYRKQGKGTDILATRKPGELIDVLGPLGHGFPITEAKAGQTALIVGGGIGVPPLYELSTRLVQAGVKVIHVLGFQTANAIFYREKFEQLGQTYIATDDGSCGEKGYVTDVIQHYGLTGDIAYACGPIPMLQSLKNKVMIKKLFISLEERMGCGIGACYACVCRTGDSNGALSYKKVCSDGPVFAAEEVQL